MFITAPKRNVQNSLRSNFFGYMTFQCYKLIDCILFVKMFTFIDRMHVAVVFPTNPFNSKYPTTIVHHVIHSTHQLATKDNSLVFFSFFVVVVLNSFSANRVHTPEFIIIKYDKYLSSHENSR